ncbi:NB-ARC domain-containing protein [Streptomyces sp. NPDC101118]|uniref:NB-ARC domain-containing protein n=1 Tax=Streptomyces sp. NPDC101118 TaxID=3366109 RepID=UPI0037F2C7B2
MVKGVLLGGVVAVVAVLASLAANAATAQERWPGVLDQIRQRPWWWVGGLGTVALIGALLTAWRQERPAAGAGDPSPPPAEDVADWVVGRAEGARAVAAVCRRHRRGAVALTSSLDGDGGFGKTTLARLVSAHPRVRRRFRDRVYVVTVGRDVRGRAAVAAKVAEVTRYVTGDTRTFDDPGLAGRHLGRLLDQRPRTLLVLDDVWEEDQLTPFLQGGRNCVRLVTTRVPELLPPGTRRVAVGEMTTAQARAVLTWELPPLPEELTAGLLRATGRWALLLRLTNRLVAGQVAVGADPAAAARAALDGLAAHGPAAGESPGPVAELDLDDPARRSTAVRATVEAATTLLPADGPRRLAELGVFTEDEAVPVALIARLWAVTGGLDEAAARTLCGRLNRLSLVSVTPGDGGRLTLHDVLRDYLRGELGEAELRRLHGLLADEAGPEPWENTDGYLLDHLVEHLLAAGRTDRAEALVADLRWVEARLHRRGPSAPWQDARRVPTDTGARVALHLDRIAHLLAPLEPAGALTATLHSRLAHEPLWREQIRARQRDPGSGPLLYNRWDPPDLPDSRLLRTLTGHTRSVKAMAVSADGSRLASADEAGSVRVWDVESGRCVRVLRSADAALVRLALSPDGTVLVIGDSEGRLRILDAVTGAWISGRRGGWPVNGAAFAPDGAWLVTGTGDGLLRVWEPGRWRPLRVIWTGGPVSGLRLSPDGSRLATGSGPTLRLWSTADWRRMPVAGAGGPLWSLEVLLADDPLAGPPGGTERHDFAERRRRGVADHDWRADRMALAPDGSWLAVTDEEGLHLWAMPQGTPLGTVRSRVLWNVVLEVAPDGNWLATGSHDGTIRFWEVRGAFAGRPAAGPAEPQYAVAFSPDGSWLTGRAGEVVRIAGRTDRLRDRGTVLHAVHAVAVAADGSRTVSVGGARRTRVYDTAAGTHTDLPVSASDVALAPDASWLALVLLDGTVAVWESGPWRRTSALPGSRAPYRSVAVGPAGDWIAVGDADGAVCVWTGGPSGPGTWHPGPPLPGHAGTVLKLVVSPDGRTLASAGADGTVQVSDTGTWTRTHTLTGHEGAVRGVAFSPDGAWLASVGGDATVRVWEAATGRAVTALRTEGPLSGCAWHPDGRDLAVCGSGGLYLFGFLGRCGMTGPGPTG